MNEVLFTFPIAKQRLDIFREFLWPAKIEPKAHKQIESLAIMLQMVEHQRGICVLPAWLAESYCRQYQMKQVRLGVKGIFSTLYATVKKQDQDISYLDHFIKLGQQS